MERNNICIKLDRSCFPKEKCDSIMELVKKEYGRSHMLRGFIMHSQPDNFYLRELPQNNDFRFKVIESRLEIDEIAGIRNNIILSELEFEGDFILARRIDVTQVHDYELFSKHDKDFEEVEGVFSTEPSIFSVIFTTHDGEKERYACVYSHRFHRLISELVKSHRLTRVSGSIYTRENDLMPTLFIDEISSEFG